MPASKSGEKGQKQAQRPNTRSQNTTPRTENQASASLSGSEPGDNKGQGGARRQDEKDAKSGFQAGHESGQPVGHQQGYDDSYLEGFEEGYIAGCRDCHNAGFQEGHQAGYYEGYQAGYTAGATGQQPEAGMHGSGNDEQSAYPDPTTLGYGGSSGGGDGRSQQH